MINKYFDGQIPPYTERVTEFDADLEQCARESIRMYHAYMNGVNYPKAIEESGRSYHVLTNTSTRQLHGSWQKMKHSAINWQVS